MARMAMDHGAVPMSYFSSAPSPYAVPAQQAPYYAIPHHFPAQPQYVYSPAAGFECGQPNAPPVFRVMPSQIHHQHPVCGSHPARADVSKNEVSVEALENAFRPKQQLQPHRVQQLPSGRFGAPSAPHPAFVVPDGAMLGQPVHYNGYPVYRMDDTNRSHVHGGQRPGGAPFATSHGMPIYAPTQPCPDDSVCEFPPYGLPASQPGMRWKLVPVSEPDVAEPSGAVPSATAPLMLLQSPDTDSASGSTDSPPGAALKLMPESVRGSAPSSGFENPYEQFLSLLLPQLKDGADTEGNDCASKAGGSPHAPAIAANPAVPESEVAAAAPKSVKVIPVTDPLSDDKTIVRGLTEKVGSVTSTKGGSGSQIKQPKKAGTPVLKPIKLVPSLDFVKKDGRHTARSKEEKQVAVQENRGATNPQQASQAKEVPQGEIPKEAALRSDGAGSKMDVGAEPLEESGNRPSAKKVKSLTIADRETAARLIQSAYRGHSVRRCQPLKHLRDISRVKSQLKDFQALAADTSFLDKCKDPVEQTRISEGIMNLLLQLDVIQGVDPVVRDIRKFTSKEVLKLQSEVDAVMERVSSSSSSSPLAVSASRDEPTATAVSLQDAETLAESNPAETNENGDHQTAEMVPHPQAAEESVEQTVERVEFLLRKLLSKLSRSEGPGAAVDSELIAEVVRKLSSLEQQQRDTMCSDSSARGDMAEQEVAEAGLSTHDNLGDEILHSLHPPTSDGVGGGTGKDALRISEPAQMDLENLVEDVAADFVNAVLTLTEESDRSSESTKEQNLGEREDGGGPNDRPTLHEEFEAAVAVPPQSAGGDAMAAASEPMNSGESTESRPEIVGATDPPHESSSFPLIVADNRPEDDDEAGAQTLPSECLPDLLTHGSCDTSSGGDGDEPASDLGPHEEPSNSALVAELEAVSTKSLAAESEVQEEEGVDTNLNTENEESVEVEGENDVAPGEYSFSQRDGSRTCPDSHHLRLQSETLQGAEMLATDADQDRAPKWDPLPAAATVVDRSETPENMKVHIPDNQDAVMESPTSVLDAVASMAPAEDVAETTIAEEIPQQASIPGPAPAGGEKPETQPGYEAEKEAQQLESAISNLQSLNNEGEFFLNDQSLQLESAISNLQSLNNTGQGFLNNLNPENGQQAARRIGDEVGMPKPPSLSAEAQRILEDGGCLRDACERLYASASSRSSVTKHLVEENVVLRRSLRDVLLWSQWQSVATLRLMKLLEKLESEVWEVKRGAKKGKLGRKKHISHKSRI